MSRIIGLIFYCLALLLLIHWGAFQVPVHPSGADWQQYVMGATSIWNPQADLDYPLFRRPMFMIILGYWSQYLGVVAAGVLLSTVGCLAAIVGVCWWVWIRCGPVFSGVTALIFVVNPLVVESFSYTTPYPFLGGCLGLALGLSASFKAHRTLLKAFCFGLLLGLSFAIDRRSVLMLPLLTWSLGRGVFCLKGFLPITLGFLCFYFLDQYLGHRVGYESMHAMRMLEHQREFLFKYNDISRFYPQVSGVENINGDCHVSWSFSCALTVILVNLSAWSQVGLIWLGLPLLCLFLKSTRPMLLVWVSLLSIMAFVWAPPRYFWLLAPGLLVAYPFVFQRAFGPVLGLLASLLFVGFQAVSPRQPISVEFPSHLRPMAESLIENIPKQATLTDCSGLDIAAVGMPFWTITWVPLSHCNALSSFSTDWVITKDIRLHEGWIAFATWADHGTNLTLYKRQFAQIRK